MPAAVAGDPACYAPFVPRSTPKNGESDGLLASYGGAPVLAHLCCWASLRPLHIGMPYQTLHNDVVSERSPCARPKRVPAGEECTAHNEAPRRRYSA